MAAKGRPTTNPMALDRKAMAAEINILSATESDPIARVAGVVAIMERHADGFAYATASNVLGNGLRADVRDAMVKAQDGQCFTCGVTLNNAKHMRQTEAVLFRLVPSIVGADHFVAGNDAMAAGTVPGNVVAVCAHCNRKRNAASAAMGTPVCVTSDVLHADSDGPVMLNATRILYVWPATPKARDTGKGDAVMADRDAARVSVLGW